MSTDDIGSCAVLLDLSAVEIGGINAAEKVTLWAVREWTGWSIRRFGPRARQV